MQSLLVPLIQPLNLLLTALVAAIVFALLRQRHTALGIAILGAVWTLAWSLPATSLWLGGSLEQRHAYLSATDVPMADAIVVLGGHTAQHRDNWFLPHHPATMRSRVARAAELYQSARAPRIVVSGGSLEGKASEARNMARLLRLRGVPESALLLENRSRTTYENVVFTHQVLRDQGIVHPLLVTSALHMPRAMAVFGLQTGLTVIAAPVAPQIRLPDDQSLNIWLPDLHTLNASRSIIKEYAGLLLYWLRGWA